MFKTINSRVDPHVFWWSNFLVYFLVFFAVFFGPSLIEFTEVIKKQFINSFGWSYIIFSVCLVSTLAYVIFKFGHIRIGGKGAKPDFSRLSWLSMLFSAGLGTGLIYAGVLEPLAHFHNAPQLSGYQGQAKFVEAMDITFFHWGFTAWMMYSATGLMFAILSFNLNKSFQFAHFVPDKFKKIKVVVNVAAILSILIGVITTFVMAAFQMSSGLVEIVPSFLGEYITPTFTIALVTLMATFSVLSGLKRGIRLLSELNVFIAFSLFVFVFFNIDQVFYFKVFFETLSTHVLSLPSHLFYRSFSNDKVWLSNWTILYWAWWTAWLPFVGLFIARISKGRTIREYALGTVIVPSIVTFLWFSLFGSAGYLTDIKYNLGLRSMLDSDPQNLLFTVLDSMPFSTFCTSLAVVCVLIFYVTSSDSGSYVVDMISSGESENQSPHLKVYWSILEGALAIVLLQYGGAAVIKNLVILISLPVLLYICYGMIRLIKILKEIDQKELSD